MLLSFLLVNIFFINMIEEYSDIFFTNVCKAVETRIANGDKREMELKFCIIGEDGNLVLR